jgi:nucleoside-diphosphate-sugar epimerase
MRAGVTKVIFVSSMSAYYGTRQSYGLMKLAVERTTLESGQVVVRPGLVYGGELGGMAQTLSRLARLPVIPVFRHAHQYTLHIDDYVASMANLISSDDVAVSVIGLANATSVTFSDIMAAMSTSAHGTGKMITVPWHVVLQLLRTAERLKIPLPVRSDSLLGLVQPAPFVPGVDVADRLHLSFREFAT